MNISRLEENTQAPYLLTKDGVLGEQWSHHIEDKRVVFHPINKNGRQLSNQPIKVHEDEILIKHINLDLVNQKANSRGEFTFCEVKNGKIVTRKKIDKSDAFSYILNENLVGIPDVVFANCKTFRSERSHKLIRDLEKNM